MECLDANVVQDLMSGALDVAARGVVLGHLDTCADCRELLAIAARTSMKEQPLGETRASLPGVDHDDGLAATLAPGEAQTRPRVPRARSVPGSTFGRYQLLERLGAGAMGVVWRADDPELGRKVAVKLLKQPDAALTERLVREARSMAQVNHPNVVAVYDVGVHQGETYIAMELVEGKSLRGWQTGKHHPVPQIVEMYVAAGRGLAAAHAAGLVHRDFKPDNVLVGDDGRVRVTDFGLAAVKPGESGVHHAVGDIHLTTEGSVLGTPAYMAPEQFTDGHVDSRTDQFNFCVSLYEALYGERPFEGRSFTELGDNVCAGKVKPPPERTAISSALRAIVLRGMAAKPGDRYATMDHLLAELGRDRARPWRISAIAFTSIACLLAIGLAADYLVRARGARAISQAFAATGKQVERAGQLQVKQFRAATALVEQLKVMIDVTSSHDEADFGLEQSPEQDAARLEELHDTLVSQDWRQLRGLGESGETELAVADYKNRVLYSSAAPSEWRRALDWPPAIKQALEAGKGEALSTVRYDDPMFAQAKLFGATPRPGLAVMFARALQHAGQPGGVFLQFIDGTDVLAGIRLDDTRLGLVALDGTTVGEVSAALAREAPPNGEVAEISVAGATFQVQARPLADFTGKPIAHVVMARPVENVLSLFPHALAVFAIAMLCMIAAAIGTALRARQITGARA